MKTLDLHRLVQLLALASATVAIGAESETVKLSPFEVREKTDSLYAATETNTGTLIAKPRDEIPFVTSVLKGAAIADLNLNNPSDFATQFAGVARGPGDQMLNDGAQLNAGTSFTIRGFSTAPLYNGFQTGPLNVSTESFERVEVTKGPNSILYGQSSAGGTVNFVPKAALLAEAKSRVSFGASTNDGYRATFESGGGLGEKRGTGFVFGGGYDEFTRSQQFYANSQSFGYGAFRTNLTEQVSLDVNVQRSRMKTTPARTAAFVSVGAGPARVTDPNNRLRNNRNFNYHGPWSAREGNSFITSQYVTAKLSPQFTLRVGGLQARQTAHSNAIDGVYGLATGVTATGYYQDTAQTRSVTGYKADLLYQTEFNRFSVDSILGFESNRSSDRLEQSRTNPAVTPITITIPFARTPVPSDYPQPPARNLYTTLSANNRNELEWTNVRFTQFVTLPEKRGTVMWGLAQGQGDNVTTDYIAVGQSTAKGDDITYSVGGTYVLGSAAGGKWTAFANASTSFLIQAGNAQNPSDFTKFATVAALRAYVDTVKPNAISPQEGEGQELGLRYASSDGKFRVELLGFKQERSNIARDFFVRESNVAGQTNEQVIKTYQLAAGVEESKGFETSVDWNLSKSVSILASAMLSNGKVKSNVQAPEEVGFRLVNSPARMGNIWVRYAPDQGALRGFVFGLGGTYRNATRTFPTSPDRFRLSDEYTIARASVGYGFASGKTKSRISLDVENLLDDDYVAENGILSEPMISRIKYTLSW
jgi:outer membrane receptor protein involved in Fe transport